MPAPVTSSQSGLVLASWHVGGRPNVVYEGGYGFPGLPCPVDGVPHGVPWGPTSRDEYYIAIAIGTQLMM